MTLASVNRRNFLNLSATLSIGLLASTAIPTWVNAQEVALDTTTELPAWSIWNGQAFSFDVLSAAMAEKAKQAWSTAEIKLPDYMASLDYDRYRLVNFWADRARWDAPDSLYRIHPFHMGWLFKEPVQLYDVVNGQAAHIDFSTQDFEYRGELKDTVPADTLLPGIAGFKLNHPLNRPDSFDEIVAFLGASYFRALGRDNFYGISARGLAINTGLAGGEEFPRFSDFFVERLSDAEVVVYAALDSQSVTGAFRMVIRPGENTIIDVTTRLYFRSDIVQLGIAPLTSMYLYAENNRSKFDDYRPQVHDSNGLQIADEFGDTYWRALNNPPRLANSYFAQNNPNAFGLMQRDRDFQSYQDAEAHYEKRPSLLVEPVGDWGEGNIRLVEIPTDLEVNDNIVAFWVPKEDIKAGQSREYAYRLTWGSLDPEAKASQAYVFETRAGRGGISGVKSADNLRKFVVDFKAGTLGNLPADADLEAVTTVSGGTLKGSVLSKIMGTDIWRLVLEIEVPAKATVEMVAHIAGYSQKLSETWLYQWINE